LVFDKAISKTKKGVKLKGSLQTFQDMQGSLFTGFLLLISE